MVSRKDKSAVFQTVAQTVAQTKCPIVVVLGHVDHGKTTLLDTLRKSSLTSKEYGGITQHIGAYQVLHKEKKITFIDTPGHEAFAKMRSSGAKVADLAILVVAADDGVKPQTKEAIKHIQAAKVPFLVAINKIDLVSASPDMVKAQLAEAGVFLEGYGGKIVSVLISAKENKGLEELKEMTVLLSEIEARPTRKDQDFEGVIIESRMSAERGPLASLIVRNGELKVKDKIVIVDRDNNILTEAKIKAMFDEWGKRVTTAEQGKPVEILGIKKIVPSGSRVYQKSKKQEFLSEDNFALTPEKTDLNLLPKEEKKRMRIILKADVLGTLEAIKNNLPDEVEVIIGQVGGVTESDVLMAISTKSTIIAFNVNVPFSVAKLALMEKITIKNYTIIYKLLEEIQAQVLHLIEPTIEEVVLGEATVIAEFKIKGKHIAGLRITKGRINKNDKLHLKRGDKIIGDAQIKSLQKEKQEIEEAKVKSEIGIVFRRDLDFKIGDVILSYSIN